MKVEYKNSKSESIVLTNNDHGIKVLQINGLAPDCIVNTTDTAGCDGSIFINSYMPERNITLLLNLGYNAEQNRRFLYTIFLVKQFGTLYFTGDDGQEYKIDCIVEKMPYKLEEKSRNISISLLCPQPYFESLNTMCEKIASVKPLVTLPFTPTGVFYFSKVTDSLMVEVENPSSVDVGMEVVFYANSLIENPSLLNVNTYEMMKLNYTMQAGDTITVNTHRGKKAITLTRNGVETNLFNYKFQGFKFLQLYQGNNLFRYNADSNINGLGVSIFYKEYYAGV